MKKIINSFINQTRNQTLTQHFNSDAQVRVTSELGEEFKDRVELVVKAHGSANSFAKAMGVSEGVVRKWIKGESDPSRSNLIAIAKIGGVNLLWLATGEGPMQLHKESVNVNNSQNHCEHMPTLDENLLRAIIEGMEEGLQITGNGMRPAGKANFVLGAYDWLIEEKPKNPKDKVIRIFTEDVPKDEEDAARADNQEGDDSLPNPIPI